MQAEIKQLFEFDPNIVATWTKAGKFMVGLREMPPRLELQMAATFSTVMGLPTEFEEVGNIRIATLLPFETDRTIKMRPCPGGMSIGHYAITAGTLGKQVLDAETKKPLILSNNHVLAASNEGIPGDMIYQPGKYDWPTNGNGNGGNGGSSCPLAKANVWLWGKIAKSFGRQTRLKAYVPKIVDPTEYEYARLVRFIPINWDTGGGNGGKVVGGNVVDCALARPIDPAMLLPEILEIGEVFGWTDARIGMEVMKSGRTTGLTRGTIDAIDGTIKVSYGGGKYATFEHQILTRNIVSGGDSGSYLVATAEMKAVGLVFAGSNSLSVMNPIKPVMDGLAIEV